MDKKTKMKIYYKKNKIRLNQQRVLNAVKRNYPVVNNLEQLAVWQQNRTLLKSIFAEKDIIDLDVFIQIIKNMKMLVEEEDLEEIEKQQDLEETEQTEQT